jgi:hypothetical protein
MELIITIIIMQVIGKQFKAGFQLKERQRALAQVQHASFCLGRVLEALHQALPEEIVDLNENRRPRTTDSGVTIHRGTVISFRGGLRILAQALQYADTSGLPGRLNLRLQGQDIDPTDRNNHKIVDIEQGMKWDQTVRRLIHRLATISAHACAVSADDIKARVLNLVESDPQMQGYISARGNNFSPVDISQYKPTYTGIVPLRDDFSSAGAHNPPAPVLNRTPQQDAKVVNRVSRFLPALADAVKTLFVAQASAPILLSPTKITETYEATKLSLPDKDLLFVLDRYRREHQYLGRIDIKVIDTTVSDGPALKKYPLFIRPGRDSLPLLATLLIRDTSWACTAFFAGTRTIRAEDMRNQLLDYFTPAPTAAPGPAPASAPSPAPGA